MGPYQNQKSLFGPPAGGPHVEIASMVLEPLFAAAGAEAGTADAAEFASLLFVFLLATFIGLGVITRVSRLLHTPLMSLTNAISAIAVVASLVLTGREHPTVINVLGAVALAASMTNIVSGFLITDRMLKMFKRPGGEKRA